MHSSVSFKWAVWWWNGTQRAKRLASAIVAALVALVLTTDAATPHPLAGGVTAMTVAANTSPPATAQVAPDSIAMFTQMLKKDSTSVSVRFRLGNALYDAGRKDEALDQYKRILARKPDYVETLVNMGILLNEVGKSDEAADALAKAIGLRPNDALALASMGNVLYGMQKYPEASDMYRKALSADAKCYQAWYYWGIAFADAGIYREAINKWQKVVDLAPTSQAAESAKENIRIVKQFIGDR